MNTEPLKSRDKDFGGFPGPLSLARHALPTSFRGKIQRKLTIPYTQTLNSQFGVGEEPENPWSRVARWLPFDGLQVGRNSHFNTDDLTDEQLEHIGGIEYRALRVLGYLVSIYFIGTQVVSFILIAPYMSTRYKEVFSAQPRLVPPSWQVRSNHKICACL